MPWIDLQFEYTQQIMTDIKAYDAQHELFHHAYAALLDIYEKIFTPGHSIQLKALAVGFRDLVRHITQEFEKLPLRGSFTGTSAVNSDISENLTKYELMQADLLLLLIQAQSDLQRFWIDLGIYKAGALVKETKYPEKFWNIEEYVWTTFCTSVTKLSQIPSLQSTMQWERERPRETGGVESIEERSRKRQIAIINATYEKEKEERERAIRQKEKTDRAMSRKKREQSRDRTDKLHSPKGNRDKSKNRELLGLNF